MGVYFIIKINVSLVIRLQDGRAIYTESLLRYIAASISFQLKICEPYGSFCNIHHITECNLLRIFKSSLLIIYGELLYSQSACAVFS